jgi:RNA polymerase sigma-70 factor, ECF subfamily
VSVSLAAFEAERGRLFAIAYRMLGSAAEAEDVVQEAWLRAQSAGAVDSPRAWLATVVTRLCVDQLKSARARREQYVGPWLPEPVATDEHETDRESISLAFLVLLERLSPVERAVYLLHEVFDYSHAETAAIVGKDEAAARQIFHRAREHVVAGRPRFARSREEHARLVGEFVAAVGRGDVAGLAALLAEEATAWTDSGGKARAARKPVRGADAVSRFFVGLVRKGNAAAFDVSMGDVNGWPALLLHQHGTLVQVVTFETDGERIHGVRVVLNPDKLAHAEARS